MASINMFEKAEGIEEVIGQAVGAGSMCWVGGTGDLEFDSTRASVVVTAALQRISQIMGEPDPRDDPQELLAVGTKMNNRLIGAIQSGYAKGDATEDQMIMTIFDNLTVLPTRQIAAHAMAGMFALAKAGKWDLVLVKPDDGTRIVIHCDSEEEQTTRAIEMTAVRINKGD